MDEVWADAARDRRVAARIPAIVNLSVYTRCAFCAWSLMLLADFGPVGDPAPRPMRTTVINYLFVYTQCLFGFLPDRNLHAR